MSRRGGDRTPEEREAARRARERRRYERSGEPVPEHLLEPGEHDAAPVEQPVEPVAPESHEPAPAPPAPAPVEHDPPADDPPAHEPVAHDPAPPAHDPGETVQWDVSSAWAQEHDAALPEHAEPAPVEEHVPDEPVHDAPADDAPADPPTRVQPAAHAPPPEPDIEWTDEHAAVEQPSEEHEAPLGTRRVSGHDRRHLPHIHRPTRGGRGKDGSGKGRGVRVKRPGETFGGGPRRRRSLGGRLVAGGFVLLALVVLWFLYSVFQPIGGGGDGKGRVVVTIPQGSSAGDVGTLLADRGVVDSGFFFGIRATLAGKRGDLKSGRYTLREDMSYGAALDALTTTEEPSAVPTVNVAIPEGRSRRETARIAGQAGLRGDYFTASRRSRELNPRSYGAPAGATLEGFLFPATYELRRGANVRTLIADQLRAFKQNFAGVDLRYARSKQLTRYDVLTIASMIEREVSVARERPLVAAVIYNRLRDSIPLGIDATLRFEQNDWVNPLRQSVLDADTPYNTRVRQGLPPGPIGSPGLASIKAAANPARSDALYYVVKPNTCGEHAFAPTYEQHLQNVQRYEAARAAAGGRSPTRC